MDIGTRIAAINHVEFEEAYNRAAERIRKVEGVEKLLVNVDVVHAFTVVAGSLPEIAEHRPAIDRMLPDFVEDIDMLTTYGYALLHLHAEWRTMLNTPDVMPELAAQAFKMRETFIDDMTALSRRNLLDSADLHLLRGTTGHKNVAADLLDLTRVLRRNWDKITGKCGIDIGELERATTLAMQILLVVGHKEQAPARTNALTLERRRAFKLLLDTYEAVRRALRFILPTQADVDRVAPSFYHSRAKQSREQDDVEIVEVSSDTAAAQAAGGAASTVPAGQRGGDPLGGAE